MADLEKVHRPANRVDDTILRWAGSESFEAISRMLHGLISPEAVASRTQELLKSPGHLTAAQEDQLITLQMKNLLHELEDHINGSADDKILRLRLNTLEKIGERLDRRQSSNEADLSTFGAAQAVEIGQVIELALQKTLTALRKEYPQVEESVARAALRVAMPEAVAEIKARTTDE